MDPGEGRRPKLNQCLELDLLEKGIRQTTESDFGQRGKIKDSSDPIIQRKSAKTKNQPLFNSRRLIKINYA